MLRRFLIVGSIFIGLAAAFLVPWRFILFLAFIYFLALCANDVMQETASPDGTRRAVVFQRDCGATTWFTTQVAIVWGWSDLPNEPGNVFIADDHPETTKTEVRWLDSVTLLVTTKALDGAHKAERHVRGVTVTYESP